MYTSYNVPCLGMVESVQTARYIRVLDPHIYILEMSCDLTDFIGIGEVWQLGLLLGECIIMFDIIWRIKRLFL